MNNKPYDVIIDTRSTVFNSNPMFQFRLPSEFVPFTTAAQQEKHPLVRMLLLDNYNLISSWGDYSKAKRMARKCIRLTGFGKHKNYQLRIALTKAITK